MVPNAARVSPASRSLLCPIVSKRRSQAASSGALAIVGKHPVMAGAWFRRGRWRIAPAVSLPHALRNASPRTTFIIGAG
jgi:hypothetical protein